MLEPANIHPTVSVIVPNYNHGAVLPRAIRAYLAQTLRPTEIIIIDDCSTDDSAVVAEALVREAPDVVRLLRHEVNSGPNAGVATGLAVATGEFVTFSAADDVVEPEFLQASVEALSQHPRAGLSFLDPSRVLLSGDIVERVPLSLAPQARYFDPQEMEKLFRRNAFTISSNTVVYRRAVIAALGGFRKDLEWQADWMANLVMSFRHGAVYVPRALAHFTVNPKGYGERGVRSAEGQRRLLEKCLVAIEQDYSDVAERFKRACVIPEMRLRTLGWLLATERGRRFVSPRLAGMLILREAWAKLRPLTPLGLRQWMRRQLAGR